MPGLCSSVAAEVAIQPFTLQLSTAVVVVFAVTSITPTASPPLRGVWVAHQAIAAIAICMAITTELGARVASFLRADVTAAVAGLVYTTALRPLTTATDAYGCAVCTNVAAGRARRTRARLDGDRNGDAQARDQTRAQQEALARIAALFGHVETRFC